MKLSKVLKLGTLAYALYSGGVKTPPPWLQGVAIVGAISAILETINDLVKGD